MRKTKVQQISVYAYFYGAWQSNKYKISIHLFKYSSRKSPQRLCRGVIPDGWNLSLSIYIYIGKLMERIVYIHIYNHLVNNSLIYKYQSGFLPKHSTVHQLLELYNSILNSLEKKNLAASSFAIFLKLPTRFGTKVLFTKWIHTEFKGS